MAVSYVHPPDLVDPDNPERKLCATNGCTSLARYNHRRKDGQRRFSRLCDLCHRTPVQKAKRAADQKIRYKANREKYGAYSKLRHKERQALITAARAKAALLARTCITCSTTYPCSHYIGWLGRVCKSCRATKRRAWAQNSSLKAKYGISNREYKALLLSQGGVCSICGNAGVDGKRLVVDHCHDTNRVRGLLCRSCNFGIGLFKDDLDILASVTSYLLNSRLSETG